MFVLFVFAMFLGLILQMQVLFSAAEVPVVNVESLELERLAAFAYGVDSYLMANPDFEGRLAWAQLGAAATTPSGLRGAGVPDDWWAWVQGSTYTLCARVAPAVPALVQERLKLEPHRQATTQGEAWIFSQADAAGQELLKCQKN